MSSSPARQTDLKVLTTQKGPFGIYPPDLVVMGLYGRTRLYELILGGASREMLSEPKVPVLVHHYGPRTAVGRQTSNQIRRPMVVASRLQTASVAVGLMGSILT